MTLSTIPTERDALAGIASDDGARRSSRAVHIHLPDIDRPEFHRPEFHRPDMADLRVYGTGIPLADASAIGPDALRVTWSDGDTGDFHYGWLRENDPHPASRHPLSRERLVRPLAIAENVRPLDFALHASGALEVTWRDEDGGHVSLFDAGWLRAHRYSGASRTPAATPRPDRPRPATGRWDDLMSDDAALRLWLDEYLTAGWSIVSGAPAAEGTALAFGERIGTVRSSNFGFSFDVRSKPEPISNAYTANYLSLHTDLPHYELPPGLQILHCIRNEANGGESLLSSGLAVAELLRRTEPETFRLLAEIGVAFRFQDAESEFNARHPIIECDDAGRPRYINWSNSTLAPLDVPFAGMQAMRAAIRRFVALIESPCFLIERKLEPGEILVFDNRSMLHGRTAFDPETGDRHFQGCYLETSEVRSRRNVLARTDPAAAFA